MSILRLLHLVGKRDLSEQEVRESLRLKSSSQSRDRRAPSLNTLIGAGTVFEGVFEVEGGVRIDGVFKGEASCSGTVTVSPSGQAYAHLEAKGVYINGNVRGTVRAEWVQLDSAARFVGDVYTSEFVVSRGAVFQGSCSMEPETVAASGVGARHYVEPAERKEDEDPTEAASGR